MAVVEVPLTQGKVAIIDARDWQLVSQYKWHAFKGRTTYYARASIPGTKPRQRVLMHALLLGGGSSCDHRDGNGLNNRRLNLRPATTQQNGGNRRKRTPGKSRFKGVTATTNSSTKPWQARCGHAQKYLGSFATEGGLCPKTRCCPESRRSAQKVTSPSLPRQV